MGEALSIIQVKNAFNQRVIDESFKRVVQCLDMLSEDEVWNCLSENTVSVGSQVLHIHGNTSQYICDGLGGKSFERDRDGEFEDHPDITKDVLTHLLNELSTEVGSILEHLTEDKLNKRYLVQGFDLSGIEILIHVIEHTSYHTGQISLLTKLMTGKDLGYYEGVSLN